MVKIPKELVAEIYNELVCYRRMKEYNLFNDKDEDNHESIEYTRELYKKLNDYYIKDK